MNGRLKKAAVDDIIEDDPDLGDDLMEYLVRKNFSCTREEYLDMPMTKILHIMGFAMGASEREDDMYAKLDAGGQKFKMPKMQQGAAIQHYPI